MSRFVRRHRRAPAYLRWVARSVAANAALALALLGLSPQAASAKGTLFDLATGVANPLAGQDVGVRSTPSLGDLDGDGDLDLVAGEQEGTFLYFTNTGSATAPAFLQGTGVSNPLAGQDVGFYSTLALADLDGDGDLDLVASAQSGGFSYFANTGNATSPAFVQRTGTANPLAGQTAGFTVAPTLGDLDGDGDLDLVAGNGLGALAYYVNAGSATSPFFVAQTGSANPLVGQSVASYATPTLGDFDGDGDLDLVIGGLDGTFAYAENAGSATRPAFSLRPGLANPFASQDVGFSASPAAGDLDGDGDLDLVSGEGAGSFLYDRNRAGGFVVRTGAANPFAAVAPVYIGKPSLVDLDGDGDLDLVSGGNDGTFVYFENTASVSAPAYVKRTGAANPLEGQDVGFTSAPAFGDLDGDGDLDLVAGSSTGQFVHFANTGSRTSPAFVERTGASNPLDGQDIGFASTATFGDLDGDGDLDFVSGTSSYLDFVYFENAGSATSPVFVLRTGAANPLDGLPVGSTATPTLGDLDGDGDLDLVSGETAAKVDYFENVGSRSAPVFAVRSGASNPFAGFNLGAFVAPTLGDLDGDGDLDLVSGAKFGVFSFVENTIVEPALSVYEATGLQNPLDGQSGGSTATPTLGDLDGDGDADLVTGASDGTLRYFANTGSATLPVYVQRTGSANPLAGQDVGFGSTPALGDLDGDGDLDLAVGEANGTFRTFANTGSATAPAFVVRTGATNPLDGLVAGYNPAPTLGDLDGDGDLDLVSGEYYGAFAYFENTGSATAPAFAVRTGIANPLDGQAASLLSTPALGDLDEDGDLDLVSGGNSGTFFYLENTGTAKLPAFVARTGSANPLANRLVPGGLSSAPALGDIDHDGDPDVISGSPSGALSTYFVPEPLRGLMLGAGIVLLRGLGRLRRRRGQP